MAAAEEARKIEHSKWADAQRLGSEADEATAERLSIMHERVEEIKSEMSSRSVTITSSSEASSSRVLSSQHTEAGSGDEKVDVSIKADGKGKSANVKVAVEE